MLFHSVVALCLQTTLALAATVSVDYSNITTSKGDRLPDFSFCGYHASERDLPSANSNATITLSPSEGDQAARIQDAMNEISQQGGGVLLLLKGEYELHSSITIPNATVLRGSGTKGTHLYPQTVAMDLITLGEATIDPQYSVVTNVTDDYVPIGASIINVFNASTLSPGQKIMIQRLVTEEWIRDNGMSELQRDDQPQRWIPVGETVRQPRTIVSIADETITLDIPLTDALDARYMQAQVASYNYPANASSEVGIENLSITLRPSCSGKVLTDNACNSSAISVSSWTQDSWIRDVKMEGFNFFVTTRPWAMRTTIESVDMHRNNDSDVSAGLPADITIQGTQSLAYRCSSYGQWGGQTFPVVTQSLTAGPNAVVEHYSQQHDNFISPHQRWAHGFLVENTRSSLVLGNRGYYGTGQGWAINAGVGWNVEGLSVEVSSPSLGTNWCIGCKTDSALQGNGTFVELDNHVQPDSLYWAQLHARGVQRSEAHSSPSSLGAVLMVLFLHGFLSCLS